MTGSARLWMLLGAACAAQDLADAVAAWEPPASTATWAPHAAAFLKLMNAAGHPVRDEDFEAAR